jgi:hypothetical protein
MSKFLPCKSVCPVVSELRHDVANRDCEINRLYGVIDHRDVVIDDLLVTVKNLTAECSDLAEDVAALTQRLESLRAHNAENVKRLAKVRQAAFGIVDWGIED